MATEMIDTSVSYVTQTEHGSWRVKGTRVLLEGIIYAYREGLSPEAMVECWPTLKLEQVHGAIAFYLRHRDQMDAYVRDVEQKFEEGAAEAAVRNRELRERILARHAEMMNRRDAQ